MHQPLVSIIVNNYNYHHFLKDAIDSALNQTYSNVEVIVVDDGSTDSSPKIIGEYGDSIIVILKENGGQVSAINAGFNKSQGSIIVFLDSDDILLHTAIEKVVECFDSSEIVKVHWPLYVIDPSGKKTGELIPRHPQLVEGDLLKVLIQYGPNSIGGSPHSPPTSGSAWSRNFLKKIFPIPDLGFKTSCIDYYLMVLAPVYGEIGCLNEPLGFYRVHGSNDTLKPMNEYLKMFFKWFEISCLSLSRHLKNIGINIQPEIWPRDSWYHKIDKSIQEIATVVPETAYFILVDDNQLNLQNNILGRHRSHLIEINGQYGGLPVNDETAIEHIKRHAKNGAASIIFAWTSFWWLDYYKGMIKYLHSNYQVSIKNDLLIGYNLQAIKDK